MYALTLVLLLLFGLLAPGNTQTTPEIPTTLKWSERMALSIKKRNPEPWMIDFQQKPVWSYPQGLVLFAFEQLWRKTDNSQYLDYVEEYADKMIEEDGTIKTYDVETFNIDMINSGKILFNLYEKTGNEKYKVAIEKLRNQLRWQPRTTEGGYWHKLRYPWQMWLDGAYMGSPFLSQYGEVNNEAENFDIVANQLILMNTHLRDSKTGLLYHGWDESKIQQWADPKTGRSPHFWGRAMGWYAMAIVDVLDYFPKDHPKQKELTKILQDLVTALQKVQNNETGLWYQVLDQGNRDGNYLEASASAMFVYAIAKGVNTKYLDKKMMKVAEEGYQGIIDNLIVVEENGEIHLEKVCAVAGLGGKPYRSGSYDYYINEKIKTNDPKGTGPFILASLELNK